MLVNHIKKTQFKKLEELNSFKEWQLRANINKEKNKNFEVVFTTNFKDIYGMSSRSEWSSCQNIFKGRKKPSSFESSVIGTCAAKGIGIIYLTDNTDWEGRGERMIYRGTVWLLKHKITNKLAVIVMRMYPTYDKRIAATFKALLEKHLNIEVFIGDEADEDELRDYFREVHEEEAITDKPYRDFFIETKLTFGAQYVKLIKFIETHLRTQVLYGQHVFYDNPIITKNVIKGLSAVANKMNKEGGFKYMVEVLQQKLEAGRIPPFYMLEELISNIEFVKEYKDLYLSTMKDELVSAFGQQIFNTIKNAKIKEYIVYPTNVY